MTEDEVEISLENNVLTILVEKRESREEGEVGNQFHLVERVRQFRRSFTLPRRVHSEGTKAEFQFDPSDTRGEPFPLIGTQSRVRITSRSKPASDRYRGAGVRGAGPQRFKNGAHPLYLPGEC